MCNKGVGCTHVTAFLCDQSVAKVHIWSEKYNPHISRGCYFQFF